MAQYGRHTDEYGNPIRQTDEYGNPIHRTGAGGGTLGDYGPITGSDHTSTATATAGPYANQYSATGAYVTDPHGPTGTTGAYGTDPYGATGTTGAYATDPYGATGTTGAYGTHGGTGGGIATGTTDVGLGGVHHRRSGSSSSSSSEDDGFGGRRKKGLKEKIKEKLPGGHFTTTPAGSGYGHDYGGAERPHHEKKGMMEKIKEKLPGHHH